MPTLDVLHLTTDDFEIELGVNLGLSGFLFARRVPVTLHEEGGTTVSPNHSSDHSRICTFIFGVDLWAQIKRVKVYESATIEVSPAVFAEITQRLRDEADKADPDEAAKASPEFSGDPDDPYGLDADD